jgi:predicted GTPase
MGEQVKVIIMGAGGRDFHNFNVFFRNNPKYKVVAFTATQIPGITGRRYPPELAGPYYPEGIPIIPEDKLEEVIKTWNVDLVVLSYSDLDYGAVGEKLSRALSAGASFMILGPKDTMLESSKPVIAVTAVRTGSGKSTVSRAVSRIITSKGYKLIPIRHPMAYGDLAKMAVQKFRTMEDLDRYGVTVEEREEYEQYIRMGLPVFAGVDYGKILAEAEKEGDIILWDGGNNDWPFIRPDYMITVADAMRPGQEVSSFPGEVNVRMADAIIINKADQAKPNAIERIKSNVKRVNPKAEISVAESVVEVDKPELVKNKRVLVLEDSPTVTHGGAPYAAGYVAAKKFGAAEIVDPRPYAVASLPVPVSFWVPS